MAIYSASVQIIGKGQGRSAVVASAYRAGECIKNLQDGVLDDYRKIAKRVVHAEILLPEYAPREYAQRNVLWNEVEKKEKAKNAQLSREFRIALPRELNQKSRIELDDVINRC